MSSGRRVTTEIATSPGMDTLGELFSSRIRANVLAYLIAREEARFSLTELSRALGLSVSSIQHECYKLERLGVLKGRREGASRRYWLDREQHFVPVLMWLVVSVIGQPQVLRYALHGFDGLERAFLTNDGEVPSLTLIGDLGLDELSTVHERAAKILDVPETALKVAFYDPATWQTYLNQNHPTVVALQSAIPEVLVGSDALLKGL